MPKFPSLFPTMCLPLTVRAQLWRCRARHKGLGICQKFDLPIVEVVKGGKDVQQEAYTECDTGVIVNSGFINDMSVEKAQKPCWNGWKKKAKAVQR